MSVADIRQDYHQQTLLEAHASATPLEQFSAWFDEALAAQVPEVNAMTLATVDAAGKPTARTVLLKGFDVRGFVFFTNYQSRKGAELAARPAACLLFFWPQLERQVRIEGTVEKVSAEESDTYYRSRPLGSRIGAWASPQSQARPIGAAIAWCRITSNSGRGDPAACTTVWPTPWTHKARGSACVWPPETPLARRFARMGAPDTDCVVLGASVVGLGY